MKKVFVTIAVLAQMLFAFSAEAEETPRLRFATPGKQKIAKREIVKNDRLHFLATLPVYIFTVGSVIHEGSHAAAIGLDDDFELVDFQPYPHIHPVNGFVGGSVDVECNEYEVDAAQARCADRTGLGVIAAAPYFTDVALFATSDLLLSTGAINPDSRVGLLLYLFGMGASWYDFGRNLIWAVDRTDPDVIAQNFDWPRWSVVTAATAVTAVGAWRLWVNGKRVFLDVDSTREIDGSVEFTIVPMTTPESLGVWAEVRF